MSMRSKDLSHQIADFLVATLVEHQDRRTGAAQRAAEQSGRSQLYHLLQSRYERVAIRLMQPILKRSRKCTGGSGGEGSDQQRAALDIEQRVLARVAVRQYSARLGRRQAKVRHHHSNPVDGRQPQPHCTGHATGIDSGRDDGSQNAGRHIIRMALNLSSFV